MSKKFSVIFRPEESTDTIEKDPFVEQFEKANIDCKVIEVMKFEYVHINELKEKLGHPESYSGLVLSSPRCITAIKLCNEIISEWKNLRTFVVGPRTRKLAEDLGLKTEGSECGNGKSLAEFILKEKFTKKLLLPTGNLSKDLSQLYQNGGIIVDHVIVYKTLPHPDIWKTIGEMFTKHKVEFVLYFSPSSVNFTFPILHKLGIELHSIKWAAIGPTTESELLKHSVQVPIVATSPTPQHFGLALQQFLALDN